MTAEPRATGKAWVEDFTEAFNRENIDEVMAYFADDAVYDEFHGGRHVGKAAIRAAFEPQFAGKYGRMRFHTEDMFLDAEAGKAMISWLLTRGDRRPRRRLARPRPAAFPRRQAGRETDLRQDRTPADRQERGLGGCPAARSREAADRLPGCGLAQAQRLGKKRRDGRLRPRRIVEMGEMADAGEQAGIGVRRGAGDAVELSGDSIGIVLPVQREQRAGDRPRSQA